MSKSMSLLSKGDQVLAVPEAKHPSHVFTLVAPNLKRNLNGVYFAFVIRNGTQHKKSLETTDRVTANRKLKEYLETLDVTDPAFERMTLNQLLDRYLDTISGKAPKTVATRRGFIRHFRETWHLSLDMPVARVKTGDLKTWFNSSYASSLKPNSFNECLRILHCVFDLAVTDGAIALSPLRPKQQSQQIKRKRVRGTIRRPIPTPDEVEKIIAEIRKNRFTDHAADSADFVEFLTLAGLGQAEAASLTWGDVSVEKDIHTESPNDKIFIERKKTKGQWAIPVYPALRPLLIKLHARHDTSPAYDTPILRIKDAKKAVSAACRKLGIRHYEQRAFRRFFIASCIKRGVNPKAIARWQNHHDGGRLIMETYSELFEEAYNTSQEDLNKLR